MTQAHQTGMEDTAVGEADDEVLFVFSAPRRRKKKRKRLGSSRSLSGINQSSKPLLGLSIPIEKSTPDASIRRGTTGTVQSGSGEKKPILTQSTSLPEGPPPILQQRNNPQFPVFDPTMEPNFAALHNLPLPESCSMQWWNDPLQAPLVNTNIHNDWMSFDTVDAESNKRKQDVRPDETRPQLDSLEAEISPRTKHATIMLDPNNSFEGISFGRLEVMDGENSQTDFQAPSYFSTTMPSWSANWNAFGRGGQGTHISRHRRQSTTPRSITHNNYTSLCQQAPRRISRENNLSTTTNQFPQPHEAVTATTSSRTNQIHVPLGENISFDLTGSQRGFGGIPTLRSVRLGNLTPCQQSLTIPTNSRHLTQTSAQHTQQPSPQPHTVQNTTFRPMQQIGTSSCQPNDILRKPSLYKIPPWPSQSPPSQNQASLPTRQLNKHLSDIAPSNQTQNIRAALSKPDRMGPSPTTMRPQTFPSQEMFRGMNTRAPQMANPPQPEAHSRNLQPPKGGARKYSSNLIVDIAETCQELFPFATVAERHSVPIKKVFDTFSAIIQLPLLRSADDRRRHGSLGKRRQKEFRDAKKAMEKAHATGVRGIKRVASETGLGCMMGEKRVRGRGKEKPKSQELLKHAILNNVRESQSAMGVSA